MRKIYTLLLAFVAVFGFQVQGQNYIAGVSTGTSEPYNFQTGGTQALTAPANDQLSTWQTLPFTWDFYGTPVTGYYISDNGYITFDQGATTSFNTPTTLPDAGGPNNAIYAFWADWQMASGGAVADRVETWTYDDVHGKVHVIQWYSVTPVNATTFAYAAIRLYECGDFDVVLNYANATISGSIGAENAAGTMGVEVFGSPNFAYPSGLASAGNDDAVYSFYWDGVAYDIQMNSVNLGNYATINQATTISGELQNKGTNNITSFDLHYQIDSNTPETMNVTGVNIIIGGTYNYSHSQTWVPTAGGVNHTVRVWADNINGSNADDRSCNDELSQNVFTNLGNSATRRAMIEEFTGAWCQFCPDGAVVLDQLEAANGDMIAVASIHSSDQMEFNDGIRTAYNVSSYPSAQIDRRLFDGESRIPFSRSLWASRTTSQLNEFSPLLVNVGSTFDSQSRNLTVDVEVFTTDYAAGDLRVILYIIEDSVIGTGTGYDQVNFYNTQSGHPYFGAGNPIVGYPHRHTLRSLPNGTMGDDQLLPATIAPNTSTTGQYTTNIDAGWDETKINVVAAVYQYDANVNNGVILNMGQSHLGTPIVLADAQPKPAANSLTVFPNPITDMGIVQAEFSKTTSATFEVYNTYGQKVALLKEGTFTSGKHNVYFDVQNVPAGIYFVNVNTPEGSLTEKIIVSH